MKKFIFIVNAIELVQKLATGKRIQGVLYVDSNTGVLTFKAYNRNRDKCPKDVLVCKTPYGWVKQSLMRIKRFTSVPIDLPPSEKLTALDHENELAKEAMLDCELSSIISKL